VKSKRSGYVKSILQVVVAVWCLGAFFATPVVASGVEPNILYRLFDHPDAALFKAGGPPYGLRLDFIDATFSVSCVSCGSFDGQNAFVTLLWGGGDTALITGQLWNNALNEMWTVSHTITGVFSVAKGFEATGGVMLLTPPGGPSLGVILGKQDSAVPPVAFRFLADGHRLPDDYTIVGRGWFDKDGTNDWIVTAQRVPEPATLFLLGPGLLGLGFFRKRLE